MPPTFAQGEARWDLLQDRGFFDMEEGYPTDTHYNSKDTDNNWWDAFEYIMTSEGKPAVAKKVKGNRNNKAKSSNAMRTWANIGRTASGVWKLPRSRPKKKVKKQSTQLEMDTKLSSLRSFLGGFAKHFADETGIENTVVLPMMYSTTTCSQLLQEHDNETHKNLVHLTTLVTGYKRSAPAKKAVDGLIQDFGLMTMNKFTEKYGQVIEDSNHFGSVGMWPWHVLLVLEYSDAPIPEDKIRYPPVAVVMEMVEEKVNNDYAFLSSVTLDQGVANRDIMQEYFDTNNFHNIVVPYKEAMNSRPDNPKREYHKVVKEVYKSRNCNCKAHCKALRKNQVEGSLSCPRLHPTTTQSDHFTAEGVRLKAQDNSETSMRDGWKLNTRVGKHEPHLQQLCPMHHAAKDAGHKARLIGCDNDALKEAEGQSYRLSIVDDDVDLGTVSGIVVGQGYSRRHLTHYEVAVDRREGGACLYSEYPFDKFAPSAVHAHHEFEESKVWLITPSSIIIQGPDGEDVEVSIPFDLILDTEKRGSISQIIRDATSLKSYVDLSARESSVTNDILGLDHHEYHYLARNPDLQQQLGVTFSPKVTVNEGGEDVTYVVLHLQELPTTNDLFTRCISNKEDVTLFEGVKYAPGKADIYSAGFGLQSLINSARAGLKVITDKGMSTCLLDFCDASIVSNLFCISKDVNKSVLEYTKNTSRNLSIKKSPTEEEDGTEEDDTSDEVAPPKQKKQKQESEDTTDEPMDEDRTLNIPPIVVNPPVVEQPSTKPITPPKKSLDRSYLFLDKVRAVANREGGWVVNGGWDAVAKALNWNTWGDAKCKNEFARLMKTVPGIVDSKLTKKQVKVVSEA